MAFSRAFLVSFSLLLVTLLLVPGCGGPAKANLSGSVSLGEKPVKMGKVFAYGGDGVVKEGDINPDGSYLVKDVVVGAITLTVLSPNPAEGEPERKGADGKAIKAPGTDGAKANPKDWIAIPLEYMDVKTSSLKTTITAGDQKYDIKMTKKK